MKTLILQAARHAEKEYKFLGWMNEWLDEKHPQEWKSCTHHPLLPYHNFLPSGAKDIIWCDKCKYYCYVDSSG